MKKLSLLFLLLTASLGSKAFGVTCTAGDWVEVICSAEDWGSFNPAGSRCWDNTATQAQMITGCTNAAAGCKELGGCFGPNPVGHWVVTVINNKKVRCRCGCFGEDTKFAGPSGVVTGSELIDLWRVNKEQATTDLLAYNPFHGDFSVASINGITSGPEKEDVFIFITKQGQVTLTRAHPVVIADETGKVVAVKAASQVSSDDYLLSEDGKAVKIDEIKETAYEGLVVNFNVAEESGLDHFVSANGFIMGDNAWQQVLAGEESRLLSRLDILRDLENGGVDHD
ncbi:MAG: hypothetical protein HRU19_24605 [Pseudobacteriovorax sp.]|nr:hypothetical protein [Pseudobacteriovorax sp.]